MERTGEIVQVLDTVGLKASNAETLNFGLSSCLARKRSSRLSLVVYVLCNSLSSHLGGEMSLRLERQSHLRALSMSLMLTMGLDSAAVIRETCLFLSRISDDTTI